MRIVYIEWHDCSGVNGWQDRQAVVDSHLSGLSIVKSVGHVIRESADAITIASNWSEDDDRIDAITNIPRLMVQYQQELTK